MQNRIVMTRSGFLCAVVALAAGCGGGGNRNNGNNTQTRQVMEQTIGPFRMVVSLPKQTYRKAESIPITVAVTNNTGENVTLFHHWTNVVGAVYLGGNTAQFTVRQNDIPVLDSFPYGDASPYSSPMTLKAGATYTETFQWEQSDVRAYYPFSVAYDDKTYAPNTAPPGQYQITVRSNLALYSVISPDNPAPEFPLLPPEEFQPFTVTIEP